MMLPNGLVDLVEQRINVFDVRILRLCSWLTHCAPLRLSMPEHRSLQSLPADFHAVPLE
jgi:hypothetical protein